MSTDLESFAGEKKISKNKKKLKARKRKQKQAETLQSERNPKLDSVNWEVRARCDLKLLWQITMGDGMDIFQSEQVGLFVNTWTPTEEDMKLLSSKPAQDDKDSNNNKDENKSEPPTDFRLQCPESSSDKCGKYCCFFDEGSFLYL